MENPVELLAAAVHEAAPNFAKITAADLDRPTPCSDWDLRALLNHVCARFVVSKNAAELQPTPSFDDVEREYVGDDPAGVFASMSSEMLAAWESCTDFTTERTTPLGPVPAEGVLLFGAQDVFVHSWDVARSLDVPVELSDEMVEVFTGTHRQSIDEQTRVMFFGPEVEVSDAASPIEALVGFLGRNPGWGK